MVSVWRVHIRPTGGTEGVDYARSYELCLSKNVIGIGWGVTDTYSRIPKSLRDYRAESQARYPDGRSLSMALGRLLQMEQHDLVWIRSPRPHRYHLCRIVGPWDYRDSTDYRAVDIINVRPVEIVEIETPDVPGIIQPRFVGGSTIDPIKDQDQVQATIDVWHRYHADP